MNYKPTHASVTDVPCTCQYLDKAANDPDNPITFDEDTNEYHFNYRTSEQGVECSCPAMLVVYHCPFCGGVAPKTKRGLLFAKIPKEEETRLKCLLAPIQTISDAIENFGTPDFEDYSVSRVPECGDASSRTEFHRDV